MNKKFLKNAVMLYGITIAKIVFPLLTLPYLTRVLSVDSYSVVAYVKSIMQYMQIFIDFGFLLSGTKSIVEVRENKDKIGVVAGNVFLARLILSCISFGIIIVLIGVIGILRENSLYLILSFLSVFLSIFLFEYLFRGIEQMETVTLQYITMRGIAVFLTFIFVKNDNDIMWIPILEIVGSLFAILLVNKSIKKLEIRIKLGDFSSAFEMLCESGVYFMANMATTVFGALNTVLIGAFLTKSDVAYWSVCLQIVGGIQSMYSPIIDAIYPQMVKLKDLKMIKNIFLIFMPLILLGCIISYVLAPLALQIVGGNKYVAATSLFRVLIPVLFFSFPGMMLGWPTLGVFGRQTQVTQTTICAAIFQVIGILCLIAMNRFTVINLAILRSSTEFVLFFIRFIFVRGLKINIK